MKKINRILFIKKNCLFWVFLTFFLLSIILMIFNYAKLFRMVNGNTLIVRNIRIKLKKGYFFIKRKPIQNHSLNLIYIADVYPDYGGIYFLANLYDISEINYNFLILQLKNRGFFHRRTKVKGYTVDIWYCFLGKNKNQHHIIYIFPELNLYFDFNIGGEIGNFFRQIEIKIVKKTE